MTYEWPLSQISRSQYYSTSNNSQMVQDRAIVTMAGLIESLSWSIKLRHFQWLWRITNPDFILWHWISLKWLHICFTLCRSLPDPILLFALYIRVDCTRKSVYWNRIFLIEYFYSGNSPALIMEWRFAHVISRLSWLRRLMTINVTYRYLSGYRYVSI